MSENKKPKLGETVMECATCHRIFSGLTNFDKHRTGDERLCVDPSTVGLVWRENRQLWSTPPMTEEQKMKAGWL